MPTSTPDPDRLISRLAQAESRLLRESLAALENYVDPNDAYAEDGEVWEPLAAGGPDGRRQGFRNQRELDAARAECRALAMSNEFAINGHENRISYIVGSGHRYLVATKPPWQDSGHDAPDRAARRAQAVIDAFCRENKWRQRQQEIVRRRDRDGEAFLRLFIDPLGHVRVRFLEPWQVTAPPRLADDPAASFGVQADGDDVETVHGYWLDDGELVPAEDVQHRKANVDANVKRGVPLFYPVRKNLRRAEKLLRNMAAVSDIQTAVALIRKHQAGARSAVEQLRSNLAAATTQQAAGGQTTYHQNFQPGTILDVYSDTEYDFPARGLDASRYVLVLQAILRAVASRLVMPEFMLSSDASNAAYASTLVAEGPAVKMFERLQAEMIEDDVALLWRVLQSAARAGRLDAGDLEALEIQVEPPKIAVRDKLEEARVDQILVHNGAMSVPRMALRHGLDPEQERRLMDAWRASTNRGSS